MEWRESIIVNPQTRTVEKGSEVPSKKSPTGVGLVAAIYDVKKMTPDAYECDLLLHEVDLSSVPIC